MDDNTGCLVYQKDLLVLIDNVDVRLDMEVGGVLIRCLEELIVDVQLKDITFLKPAGELGPLAVALDALETDVLVHQSAGETRDRFFQKFIQTLSAVVFGDDEFAHGVLLHNFW